MIALEPRGRGLMGTPLRYPYDRQVAVLVAGGGVGSAIAAKQATRTTPIVFTTGIDPVALGLVGSLNRPGGNVTGSSFLVNQLNTKRLELARQLAPNSAVMGLF